MKDIIPVRIINLKHRTDRREHILREFSGKSEFECEIIEASEHEIGAIGLWQSICRIVETASQNGLPYVLICEDDHEFTNAYSVSYMATSMAACKDEGGDVLLGAVSWFDCALPVNDKLFWTGMFTGTQFMIIYQKFYEKILTAEFGPGDNADHKIATLTRSKYFMTQPVSSQKYFGYSDITVRNGHEGRLEELFARSNSGIEMVVKVARFYNEIVPENQDMPDDLFNIRLPVFAILPAGHTREFLDWEFAGKSEFELNYIDCGKEDDCPPELIWEGIKNAVRIGMAREEDVIIICTGSHRFAPGYTRQYLLEQIISSHFQGADLLLGGCNTFHRAFPVSENRYWIASGSEPAFLVIYSKFFDKLLNEPYDKTINTAELISGMTFHKMLIYPFVSVAPGDLPKVGDANWRLAELKNAALRYLQIPEQYI